MTDNIKQLFEINGGFLKAGDIYANGVTIRQVQDMVDRGEILRIKRGFYQMAENYEPNETAMIAKLFPEAILCMDTALFYFGYSDRTPLDWHLAFSRNISKSRFKLSYPAIKPYYIDEKYLLIGVIQEKIENMEMKIYDRDRVICDCLKHKNKMDSEMFNKAIQSYINDPQKNLINLVTYAKQLRVYQKTLDFIGVWL